MNRRGFLAAIGALLAAPAIVPFASLMPVRGIIMPTSNRVLTADVIAREALHILENNLVMARQVFRGYERGFEEAVHSAFLRLEAWS